MTLLLSWLLAGSSIWDCQPDCLHMPVLHQGSWTSYTGTDFLARASISRGPGQNCLASYDLVLEVTQHLICHTLFVEACPDSRGGAIDPTTPWKDWQGYIVDQCVGWEKLTDESILGKYNLSHSPQFICKSGLLSFINYRSWLWLA